MSEPWYAVQCKGGQDQRAELELGRQGYEVFRPKHIVRKRGCTRVESYFPRYLFLRLTEAIQSYASVRSTRGVLRMVGFGSAVPSVPEGLIHALRAQVGADGCLVAAPRFKVGESVRITDGPFHDLVGRFCGCSGEERVVVLLELMEREHKLVFPAETVVSA